MVGVVGFKMGIFSNMRSGETGAPVQLRRGVSWGFLHCTMRDGGRTKRGGVARPSEWGCWRGSE